MYLPDSILKYFIKNNKYPTKKELTEEQIEELKELDNHIDKDLLFLISAKKKIYDILNG